MSINFEKAFGIHETALTIRSQRAEVLANNLANADTPNFKARDIDFSKALQLAQSNQSGALKRTHEAHLDSRLGTQFDNAIPGLSYRIPTQPDTGDGNSVDAQTEQAKFAENAMQYQASLRFLNGKIKGLIAAIKGE
ncbi:flagellar basal body rod protein FlgB [Aliikangiella coralliicola]|uniref:Flagellar basal body rod protein FlgB n=1 Tax=Aliikangiella coralliicola TaxID=2592383 RepID=A0A545U635_9GAMM|nr:flagellar basal body rod protein FlgB [Aliikangiella coralliicola]TQV84873.1 flagellar basal body rod protein FlgB [Aliikangiella coralliicola]